MDPKQELAELIESYAAARSTNNSRLIQLAANLLSEYLQRVEIKEIGPDENVKIPEVIPPNPPPTPE